MASASNAAATAQAMATAAGCEYWYGESNGETMDASTKCCMNHHATAHFGLIRNWYMLVSPFPSIPNAYTNIPNVAKQ